MGTLAEKLNKLISTKESIKQAIENKGVTVNDSDTFASYADKINNITVGNGTIIKNQTKTINVNENGTITVKYDNGYTGLELVNVVIDVDSNNNNGQMVSNIQMGYLINPNELAEYHNQSGYYLWDDNDKCLYYPNGKFILKDSWTVQRYDGNDSWSEQCNYESNSFSTLFPEYWIEYHPLCLQHPILIEMWDSDAQTNKYCTPQELYNSKDEQYFYQIEETTTSDFYNNTITLKYSSIQTFNFYTLNDNGEYEKEYKYLPNGNMAEFYPLFEKIGYCRDFNPDSFDDDIIKMNGVNVIVSNENSYGEYNINNGSNKKLYADYINFVISHNNQIADKLYWEYKNYRETFQYPNNVYRLERITYPTNVKNLDLSGMIDNTVIDYIGEIEFFDNLQSFSLINDFTNVEYCLLKNIGVCENMQYFVCASFYWGINNKYNNSHQAAIDSLITYSFDRVTAGYNALTLALSAQFVESLTETEIAAITAKGFTIA